MYTCLSSLTPPDQIFPNFQELLGGAGMVFGPIRMELPTLGVGVW